MGSKRLPGKVLKPFCGIPMLQFQLNLLKKYNTGFEIVIATTENPKDQKIIQLCEKLGCKYFAGSETDVFSRFRMVAKKYNFNHIIRLTGDNPLVSYNILKNSVKSHLKNNCDLTSNRELFKDGSINRYAPKGLSMDIINCRTLLGINSSSLNSFEKEHLIPVLFNGDYSVNIFKPSIQYTEELSIDTIQEFERVQTFAKSLINNEELYTYLGLCE